LQTETWTDVDVYGGNAYLTISDTGDRIDFGTITGWESEYGRTYSVWTSLQFEDVADQWGSYVSYDDLLGGVA